MYAFNPRPTFTALVEFLAPAEGGPQEAAFTARFRARPLGELPDWSTATAADTRGFLREHLVGWGDDLVDDDGDPIAFGEAVRDGLLDAPWLRAPLLRAYLRGLTPAARGN